MNKDQAHLPRKASRLLNIILVAFLLIALRIWFLASFQHEEKLQASRHPGKRSLIEPARRATLRDRNNLPLALNKLKYQAALTYSEINSIPALAWELNSEGVKVKVSKRKAYIKELSELLAQELKLDKDRLEDEIHAKAALFHNIPFIVKEGISEEEYARLSFLSKDYPGLTPLKVYERVYPQGKLAADVVGYLGAISKREYETIINEREQLKLYLEGLDLGADLPLPEGFQTLEQLKRRLKELEELAYTAADSVGKAGVEAQFEQELRGYQGKKIFLTDARGKILREYPGGREPVAGQRYLLSLSSELQEFAEKMLALSEETRDTRVKTGTNPTRAAEKSPWIKGGAIVAMDPHTGEVLAMASYPRFDPNDFIQKKGDNIHSWLEDEKSLELLWDGLKPLSRERYDALKDTLWDEERTLSWPLFLDLILSHDSDLKLELKRLAPNLEQAIVALKQTEIKDPRLKDLLQLAVDERLFSSLLIPKLSKWTLEEHREHEQAAAILYKPLYEITKTVFHDHDFAHFRAENEKTFIKDKRLQEMAEKKYPRPYLDYLDEEENLQFGSLWEGNRALFLLTLLTGEGPASPFKEELLVWRKEIEAGAHQELPWIKSYHKLKKALSKLPSSLHWDYLATLRTWKDLERPLSHPWKISKRGASQLTQRHLASSFYPLYGYGYGRSHAYRQASVQGSIFKLVTAYAALNQKWEKKESLNLPKLEDAYFKIGNQVYIGRTEEGKPIPQLYKGGRIPRSVSSRLGKIDLLEAIETSSNPYFALLASDVLDSPKRLIEAAERFSYGRKTGIDLPGEISGNLPKDLETNPTGLFATAIGQHTLVVTPLQTAVMLSALANEGKVLKPKISVLKAGRKQSKYYEEIPHLAKFPLQEELYYAGLDFPLLNLPLKQEEGLITPIRTEVMDEIFLPQKIRKILLEGMRRVVKRQSKSSLFSLSRIYRDHPGLIADFVDMKNHIIGKTSTSEARERLDLDKPDETSLYTHVWFGGIGFEEKVAPMKFEKPDLVVVVYLKYGGYGNEAAPLAAEIFKKWREIKSKNY